MERMNGDLSVELLTKSPGFNNSPARTTVSRDRYGYRTQTPRSEILSRLRPVLCYLRMLAYLPAWDLKLFGISRRQYLFVLFMRLLCIGFATLMLVILSFTVVLVFEYRELFGLLHALTVAAMIVGIKPLINFFHFLIFLLGRRRHLEFLQILTKIEIDFGCTPEIYEQVTIHTYRLIFGSVTVGLGSLCLYIADFVVCEQILGQIPLQDLGFLLAPMISVWGIVPLFYFLQIQSIVRCYANRLRKSIEDCPSGGNFGWSSGALKHYYQKFLKLTQLQDRVGAFFGPWIFISMAWSIFTLCLTIYFITQAPGQNMQIPKEMEVEMTEPMVRQFRNMLLFQQIWSVLQITVAFVHILLIWHSGTHTNEQTRRILGAVLNKAGQVDCPHTQPEISFFVYKMNSQYYWGVNVWRAFPLERAVFFTLCSLIVTYALLLLKFNSKQPLEKEQFQAFSNASLSGPLIRNRTLIASVFL